MNRRKFFRTMIGGVAATAAVRTWPFRVYSFPTQIKPATSNLEYSRFSFGGLPVQVDPFCPPGRIYTLNANPSMLGVPPRGSYKIIHPYTLEELIKNMRCSVITGLQA
jgi:hypothetical protein